MPRHNRSFHRYLLAAGALLRKDDGRRTTENQLEIAVSSVYETASSHFTIPISLL